MLRHSVADGLRARYWFPDEPEESTGILWGCPDLLTQASVFAIKNKRARRDGSMSPLMKG